MDTMKLKPVLMIFLMVLFGFCQLATAETIEVTNTNDSGSGSLRWAINQANAAYPEVHDTIVFSNPPFDPNNPATIILDTTPLSLTDTAGTTIEGNGGVTITSSTRHLGDCIEIRSSNNVISGLQIYGFHGGIVFHRYSTTSNNTIGGTEASHRNVVSDNYHIGISLDGQNCSGNSVIGNYIGTDSEGTAKYVHTEDGTPVPGEQATGVDIAHGAHDNFVGGPTPSHRNVISGNSFTGVGISATTAATEGVTRNNHIQGNYIDIDHTGTKSIPNESAGVAIGFSAGGNIIEGNLISGQTGTHKKHGIRLHMGDFGISGTQIVGNIIGLTVDGKACPNGIGIYGEANDIIIGGPDPNKANVISGNLDRGIWLGGIGIRIEGNYIGTNRCRDKNIGNRVGIRLGGDSHQIGPNNFIFYNTDYGIVLDESTISNKITQNSITANGMKGIELLSPANGDIPSPVITDVTDTQIFGEVDSLILDGSTVEIFLDNDNGGETLLGTAVGYDGRFSFTLNVPPCDFYSYLTATVTDLNGNTSPFSDPSYNNLDFKLKKGKKQ